MGDRIGHEPKNQKGAQSVCAVCRQAAFRPLTEERGEWQTPPRGGLGVIETQSSGWLSAPGWNTGIGDGDEPIALALSQPHQCGRLNGNRVPPFIRAPAQST